MNSHSFPIIETPRFILRRLTPEDAPAVFRLFADREVTKDMGIEPFTAVSQAEELIHFLDRLFAEDRAIRWGIERKDDHALIGTCGFNGWEKERGSRGEIAYDLARPYWRRGYMTEVLRSLIAYGFGTMGLYRIEAFTNLDAIPSMQLLSKLGFSQEGILRGYAYFHGEYVDQRCFSLLRGEWPI